MISLNFVLNVRSVLIKMVGHWALQQYNGHSKGVQQKRATGGVGVKWGWCCSTLWAWGGCSCTPSGKPWAWTCPSSSFCPSFWWLYGGNGRSPLPRRDRKVCLVYHHRGSKINREKIKHQQLHILKKQKINFSSAAIINSDYNRVPPVQNSGHFKQFPPPSIFFTSRL